MTTTDLPVYDSARSRNKPLDELVQAYRYRDFILQLIRRDILTRYKRSVLGVTWTMLNPLGMMLVLTIAFSQLFSDIKAYPAYILTGLLAWTFFSQTTTLGMEQLVWGGALMSRIYVPRTVFTLSSVGTGVVNLLLSLIPLLIVMILTGAPIRGSILFLPISIVFLALFSLGVGFFLSTIAVYFPDVKEMYQIILTGWFYLTPIIYPEEIVPEAYRFWLYNLNPMFHIVVLFRQPLYDGIFPSPLRIAAAGGVSILMFIVGWILFTQRSDEFSYRV